MNIGGKAANLIRLAAIGQRVPPFYVAGTNIRVGEIRPDAFVAVRSSAVGEDAAGASFAGIHESLLFVRDIDSAIEEVRASATSERAIAYRKEKGLPLDNIEIAVVVQEMIDSAISGVVFTANPTTGDTRELVISALHGLGEGLVSVGL
ncbi:MAG TPA: PEP/pyruvate-binding domain-containing protein, partial [Thermoanaerobaculia bacterium]|nr:PEP/pyruvate-binding domain-containing protein [Thermoanaerobaculia bacterium]